MYRFGGERSAYCFGGAEEFKGGDGKVEKDGDAAAELPHAVASVGAPSVYSCGGADESTEGDGDAAATVAHAVKGGNGEEEEDGDAAATLPHAVAPVGAPGAYC